MQILALRIDDDLLEVHHNMLNNKDTIFLNGEEVHVKRRYFGTTHKFSALATDGFTTNHFRVRVGMGMNGLTFEVTKNEVCYLATSSRKISMPQRRRRPAAAPRAARHQERRTVSRSTESPLDDEDLLV
ncbi:hypothetical protein [Lewinella sp. W8]|uniref:hypothetical protein n=1 Tax=Lewinella sp. W8 TaxID=2528208 RepID=UPI0010684BED|nr:hypothetical protein [Lewinella sp. W8]MTB51389.1 hypothetical protein [Lewinella sp. W8]